MEHIPNTEPLRRVCKRDASASGEALQPVKANRLNQEISRRRFLKTYTAALGATVLTGPYLLRGQNLNSKISFAEIHTDADGWGYSGGSAAAAAGSGGNIVALCDVDGNRLRSANKYGAKIYSDYRELYDEVGKSIDAVILGTPDHHTAVASVMAMRLGKHVCCGKPLCQKLTEARLMVKLAREKNLATQMGNSGSASEAFRRAVEILRAGVVGPAKEVHVWSNRPIWPQGLNRPDGADDPAADSVDWESWIGPAPMRPYKKGVYHPGNWRGWYGFGTGALGDQGSHMLNLPFRALQLGYPDAIECEETSQLFPETFPETSRIRFEFPAREGLPSLKLWWYDGRPSRYVGNPPGRYEEVKVLRPGDDVEGVTKIKEMKGGRLPDLGTLVVGTKGVIFAPQVFDNESIKDPVYLSMNDEKALVDASKHEACVNIPKTIPRSTGDYGSHFRDWLNAMKEGKPELAYSRFEIAGILTESLVLGCVALRVGVGKKMEWDGPNLKCTNLPEAAPFVAARKNRAGWEI
jgi:hypothetical protein